MPKQHVSITYLFTGAPPLGVHKHLQSLHRGLNFVVVCVTLSATLMGYQVLRKPLWIEVKDIQQGVKVLSGPFDLRKISSHVIPETARSHSDPCYNSRLIDLPEATESSLSEEVPDMHITYCTTLAVESKLKKTSIPDENVILGNVREMTKDEITEDLIRRSWVRFPPRSKDFFFTSCGSLIPFTRANAQWVIHGFN